MLKLIIGRSGSGKTRRVLETAAEAVKNESQCVIIVPEQFTFETERELVRSCGSKAGLYVEVLSFSRLSHRVFREYGGFAGHNIDDCGRCILMRQTLSQIGDLLKVYGRQAKSTAFSKTMVDAVAEYKICGITPEALDMAAQKSGNSLLRQKLIDISLIMNTYCALLGNGFNDPLDDLTRLAVKLEGSPFFENKTVLLDGFRGFTFQEQTIIERIMRKSPTVIVTLCCERAGADEAQGLFSPVEKTAARLVALANKCGCPVASPERLTETHRYKTDDLKHLEKSVFRAGLAAYDGPVKAIRLVSAGGIYDEVQFAACEISRLVREEGCRFGEIAVISRGLSIYDGILDTVFEKYGIPLFYDRRRGIETHPLMAYTISLLCTVTEGFKQEHVLRCLKTGLAGFAVEEVSRLENYMLMWDIKGEKQWSEPWTGSLSGFAAESSEEDEEELTQLNSLRERFYGLVTDLRKRLESSNMPRALYDHMCEYGVRDAVTEACRALSAGGEAELAGEYAQIWSTLMSMLDQIYITAKQDMSAAEFCDLLRLIIANSDLGSIPPTLDAVTAGDAERMRTLNAKYVFVIGLAEGVFPRAGAAGGLISDTERRCLIELGLELSPPAEEQAAEERYFAYMAFSCASSGVYLSYPRADASGRALRPSYYFSAVKKLFSEIGVEDASEADPVNCVYNEKTAFELLAEGYGRKSPLNEALAALFESRPFYEGRLAALERASGKNRLRYNNRTTAHALYGENMRLSPSRIEAFSQCRFLYFCRYGLKAQPRRRAELDAPQIGTVIHFVLERLLSKVKERGLHNIPEQELDDIVRTLLNEFATVYMGGLDDKPERFRHLYDSLAELALCLVKHIAAEFAQSGFIPSDFELKIAEDGDIKPYEISLPDGGRLIVGGKVDRVDTMVRNGTTYLRVVDYKTGTKTFNLSDLAYGLNLQMFIYLFTLCANGGERYGENPKPSGVLYVPAKRPDVSAERGAPEEAIEAEAERQLRMNGLVLNEPQVILGMEQDGAGRFIPAYVKNEDGSFTVSARSSAATLEQFGILKRHITQTLKKMAATLREGDIAAMPVNGLNYHPCDYCDYKGVCGFGAGDETRPVFTIDKEEIWNKFKGGGCDA